MGFGLGGRRLRGLLLIIYHKPFGTIVLRGIIGFRFPSRQGKPMFRLNRYFYFPFAFESSWDLGSTQGTLFGSHNLSTASPSTFSFKGLLFVLSKQKNEMVHHYIQL
ncbi:MAG: hypothetical protein ACKESC_01665 [Candidatus Hodgkinia cicadicola]